MDTERGKRFQVGLNTRATAAIRTGDGERHRAMRDAWHELQLASLRRNRHGKINAYGENGKRVGTGA
jgi:hypothetical protein